jgi:hypothetical protein
MPECQNDFSFVTVHDPCPLFRCGLYFVVIWIIDIVVPIYLTHSKTTMGEHSWVTTVPKLPKWTTSLSTNSKYFLKKKVFVEGTAKIIIILMERIPTYLSRGLWFLTNQYPLWKIWGVGSTITPLVLWWHHDISH